jgi:DNA-3-methyladenine glycosylase I
VTVTGRRIEASSPSGVGSTFGRPPARPRIRAGAVHATSFSSSTEPTQRLLSGFRDGCPAVRTVRGTPGTSPLVRSTVRRVDDLVTGPDGVTRCGWCATDPLYVRYHDAEWGIPVHDDVRLFEKICLEGFQAGLSWLTVLRKRPALRAAFAGFEPAAVARFSDDDVRRLLDDHRIIRNRAKIEATIHNAGRYLALAQSGGTLDRLVWSYAPPASGPPPRRLRDVPAETERSRALARDLADRGWRYVGPVTVYAFMQAMGLVDDHLVGCDLRRR